VLSDELVKRLLEFRRERDWEQFHTAKNLAGSIVIEASELLEKYQWAADAEIGTISAERRSEIADEIADIAILLTYLAHDLSLDFESIVTTKLQRNGEKYPVGKSKGKATKYDRL
jgi:NTP pyrophosphatase (non-canonical NTP hydrolase)